MQITFEQLPEAVSKLFLKIENIERLLLSKNEDLQQEADQLLTIQQAAEFIKLSVPTIYGLVSKAQIPVNKRSKRLYFLRHELTEWVKSGRKKTITEIEETAKSYTKGKGR